MHTNNELTIAHIDLKAKVRPGDILVADAGRFLGGQVPTRAVLAGGHVDARSAADALSVTFGPEYGPTRRVLRVYPAHLCARPVAYKGERLVGYDRTDHGDEDGEVLHSPDGTAWDYGDPDKLAPGYWLPASHTGAGEADDLASTGRIYIPELPQARTAELVLQAATALRAHGHNRLAAQLEGEFAGE